MILYDLVGETENHPVYQELEVSNGSRQYDFLRSIVSASIGVGKPFLSQHIIKSLNFHTIACLHSNAGEYRPCEVVVGNHKPPAAFRLPGLMDDFTNTVNRNWENTDAVVLATYVLWRLNHIHPFINGNGRTARAAAYFVLCVKTNGWLHGNTILPELIRQNRNEYVEALRKADESMKDGQNVDLSELHALLVKLLQEQFSTSDIESKPD